MPSIRFATTLATIAAKAAKSQRAWTPEECVEFAWYSVNETGDAAEDNVDFARHMADYCLANQR